MSRLGKIRSAFAGAIAGAVVLGGASAALAESPMDLRVKTLPQRELSTLNMRSAAAQEASVAKKEAPARAASSKSKAPTSRLEYKAIPTEYRDKKSASSLRPTLAMGSTLAS